MIKICHQFTFALLALAACSRDPDLGTTALCGTDAAIDSSVSPPCRLVAITGQSNARGAGETSELADPSLADPYEPVLEIVRLSSSSDPLNWTEYPLSPTQPRVWQGVDTFAVELTLARDLAVARPDVEWRIAKAAIGATSLAQTWNPNHSLPSVFDDVHTWLAGLDCELAAYIWIQGEKDAAQVSFANAYDTNLANYVTALRVRFPGVPFIYGRLHVNSGATYTATVRAGQEALSASDVYLIDQDAATLRSDLTHYTTDSVLTLGHDYAAAVLSAVP